VVRTGEITIATRNVEIDGVETQEGQVIALHNGKLDYPRRILRTMQDPELHALMYASRKQPPAPLI